MKCVRPAPKPAFPFKILFINSINSCAPLVIELLVQFSAFVARKTARAGRILPALGGADRPKTAFEAKNVNASYKLIGQLTETPRKKGLPDEKLGILYKDFISTCNQKPMPL